MTLQGEESDFVRFNKSLVRQAGSVRQYYCGLNLIDGARQVEATTTLTCDKDADRPALAALLGELRGQIPHVQDDPYLLYSTKVQNTRQIGACTLPPREQTLDAILAAGKGRDLVGIHAAGAICAGFANSLGQRNWFSTHSFNFDWSFYHATDKAVKCSYAGFAWDQAAFARKVELAGEQLEILAREPKTIPPGKYRVYLAPGALEDVVGMLNWGGFGCKAHRTRSTSLLKMIAEGATMSPAVTIRENTAEGIFQNFQSSGYVAPPSVTMIENGRYKDTLICPRSAKEYGLEVNDASGGEGAASLDMAGGDIAEKDVLAKLDTGVYVNTVWYLNYSDRPGARITGMTRFATFWVEGGRIVAPLNVMRFDETMYRMLGENLVGLTTEREFIPSPSTYGGRSTASARVPGALIKDFSFTL